MARGRGLVKERNRDGTYTYAKRTADGLVVISEEEYRVITNRLSNKRPAEDGAKDSQRLKRTKSLLPDPGNMGEKIEELKSTVEHLTNRSNTLEKEKDALEAKIKELNDTHAYNWKQLEKKDEQLDEHEKVGEWNDEQFKKLQEINRQLQQENEQLKAQLERLNPQEL